MPFCILSRVVANGGCFRKTLPPWQTVYFYFRKWKSEGLFEEMMHYLRSRVRISCGKNASPSVGIIDSRTVGTSHHVDSKEYGIDGGKKVKGRKEHIVVDTLGLLMAVRVHVAEFPLVEESVLFFAFYTFLFCILDFSFPKKMYFCVNYRIEEGRTVSMILSILIPVYNYDCRQLVADLRKQLPVDAEIIVADDGSTDSGLLAQNREINRWSQCRLWESSENVGRAAIRNRLAEMAQGEYLLFMDCDARVKSSQFLENYLKDAAQHDVVCGGTANMKVCPSVKKKLRYMCDVNVERKLTLEYRRNHPYDQFTTFNFLIRRDTFLAIRFDEQILEYGHEDTLFGLNLKQRSIPVYHIENKLVHEGLDDAEEFMQKSETALRTLSRMDVEARHHARISRIEQTLFAYQARWLFVMIYKVFGRLMRRNLLGPTPRLSVLSLYRLGYYCTLMSRSDGELSQP